MLSHRDRVEGTALVEESDLAEAEALAVVKVIVAAVHPVEVVVEEARVDDCLVNHHHNRSILRHRQDTHKANKLD